MKTLLALLFLCAAYQALPTHPVATALGTESSADLVLLNGKIWTVNERQQEAEAVAVVGNRIAAAGSTKDIRRWIGSQTKVIDLQGKRVVPGFNDAHVHFVDGGAGLASVQLRDAGSQEEFRKRIGEFAAKLPKGAQLQIIYGDGLSAEAINVNAEPLQQALTRELSSRGIVANPPLFVHLSRVKIMDEVARLIACESCLFICGERPGLGFADSLSAYYIYRPATGATDADREVISNINPRGFPPAQAAAQISDSIARILRDKKSGVILG